MKTKEESLSKKMKSSSVEEGIGYYFYLEDVKEFIKETIDDIEGGYEGVELIKRLKKRAGDKLR